MNSKKLIIMILLLLLLFAIPIQVSAAEVVTVGIPFAVKNAPGTVVIEALDGAPLPEQTIFESVSDGTFKLFFQAPENYRYKIYQKAGTEAGVTYDSTVYEVYISVFVDENAGLYCVAEVNAQGNPQKIDDIVFENTLAQSSESSKYEPPLTDDNSHTGLWITLMFISLFGLVVCFPLKKKIR